MNPFCSKSARALIIVLALSNVLLLCLLIWGRNDSSRQWGLHLDNNDGWGMKTQHDQYGNSTLRQAMVLNKLILKQNENTFARMNSFIPQQGFVRWVPGPVTGGRNLYNPTLLPNGTVLMRYEATRFRKTLNRQPWLYKLADTVWDGTGCVEIFEDIEELRFTKDGQQMPLAKTRASVGPGVVIEDLRAFSRTGKNGPVLVSGTTSKYTTSKYLAIQRHTSTISVFIQTGRNSLEHIATVESPLNRSTEKNWIFLEGDGVNEYLVFYHASPITIYSWKLGDKELKNAHIVPFDVPQEWDSSEELRMSSVTLVTINGRRELMCIVHTVSDTSSLFKKRKYYSHYCFYLDAETLEVVAYLPYPLFVDVGVSIVFVMNVVQSGRHYNVLMGVNDEVGGIRVYERWDDKRIDIRPDPPP